MALKVKPTDAQSFKTFEINVKKENRTKIKLVNRDIKAPIRTTLYFTD